MCTLFYAPDRRCGIRQTKGGKGEMEAGAIVTICFEIKIKICSTTNKIKDQLRLGYSLKSYILFEFFEHK